MNEKGNPEELGMAAMAALEALAAVKPEAGEVIEHLAQVMGGGQKDEPVQAPPSMEAGIGKVKPAM